MGAPAYLMRLQSLYQRFLRCLSSLFVIPKKINTMTDGCSQLCHLLDSEFAPPADCLLLALSSLCAAQASARAGIVSSRANSKNKTGSDGPRFVMISSRL
jgi:hypothetical protein